MKKKLFLTFFLFLGILGVKSQNKILNLDGAYGYVDIPALNLNSNACTIEAWIKPIGLQSYMAGIFYCRAGGATSGLHLGDAGELRYTWNGSNWDWNSGLIVPLGVWSHVWLW